MKNFLLFLCIFFIPFNSTLAVTLSAPTIIAIDNSNSAISGLAPADSDVMIYIDGQFVGSAVVKSEGTETNNFYFSALGLLTEGEHVIKAAARDKTSYVLSDFSQEKSFSVQAGEKLSPTITKNAAEDKIGEAETETAPTPTIDENGNLVDFGNIELNESENMDGIVENVEQTSRLRWNLAIFLLFLFAVIIWIFWVNRELSREKALADGNDSSAKKNETDKNAPDKELKI